MRLLVLLLLCVCSALAVTDGLITNVTLTKIEWEGAKRLYKVQHRTSLVEGAWVTIGYTTGNAFNVEPSGFYRVIATDIPPPPTYP